MNSWLLDVYVLVRSQTNRLLFQNEIQSQKQLYYRYARSYGRYALSTSSKVLLRRDCALSLRRWRFALCMLCVLELLWERRRRWVRRVLEAVENCALYAEGTAGDALCAALYTGGCGRWILFAGGVGGGGGDALCASMYSGGCGGWDLFAGGVARCWMCR